MTTPDGRTTRYGWDAADRLTWVEIRLVGRAAFDRDATGRIVSAVAAGILQSWEHRDGYVVAHTVTDGDGATRTTIERDDDGRIARIRRDDEPDHGHRLRLRRRLPAHRSPHVHPCPEPVDKLSRQLGDVARHLAL